MVLSYLSTKPKSILLLVLILVLSEVIPILLTLTGRVVYARAPFLVILYIIFILSLLTLTATAWIFLVSFLSYIIIHKLFIYLFTAYVPPLVLILDIVYLIIWAFSLLFLIKNKKLFIKKLKKSKLTVPSIWEWLFSGFTALSGIIIGYLLFSYNYEFSSKLTYFLTRSYVFFPYAFGGILLFFSIFYPILCFLLYYRNDKKLSKNYGLIFATMVMIYVFLCFLYLGSALD